VNPVETFERYAAACRAVGHSGISAERIRDLASRDDGLGLAALQADIAALSSAAAEAEVALSTQRTAIGMLAASWRGRSAATATDLLDRHCATAAGTVAALSESADVLERLRGRLTRLLEERDEAGLRVAGRRSAEHPRWLACADAVLAGVADDAAVAEVRTRIAPFLDADVAGDWAASVTAVTESVAAAYREATVILAARPTAGFEVPSGVLPTTPPAPARGATSLAASMTPVPDPAPTGVGVSPPSLSPAAPGVPAWGPEAPVSSAPGLPAGDARPVWDRIPERVGGKDAEIGEGAEVDRAADTAEDDEGRDDDGPDDDGPDDDGTDDDGRDDTAAGNAETPTEDETETGPSAETGIDATGAPPQPDAVAHPPAEFAAPPEPVAIGEPPTPPSGPLAAEAGSAAADSDERSPCEIAADALPQIGQ